MTAAFVLRNTRKTTIILGEVPRKNNQREKQELWKYSFKNVGFTKSGTKILAIGQIYGSFSANWAARVFLFVSAELLSTY